MLNALKLRDHHTLTLMSSKGEEIKIMVPCHNWQSDTEMAPETAELPTRSEAVLPSVKEHARTCFWLSLPM